MNVIMLAQEQHLPFPADIQVVDNYGPESIVVDDNLANVVRGDVVRLRGEEQAFRNWLKKFDGVWLCSNPMLGDWDVFHVNDN